MANAVVIGGGIGGLAAGLALQRRGWSVTVLERAAALEDVGAGLAVAPNGLRALDRLGAGRPVRALSALQGTAGIQRPDGRWISRTDAAAAEARFGEPTVVVHRAALISVLADALQPGTLRLGVTAGAVSPEQGTVVTSDGTLMAEVVVAADGLHSPVRGALWPSGPAPLYAGVTSWRFVVPRPPGELVLSETWGDGKVFGVVGLGDGRVYCYATAPAPPGESAAADLARLFDGWHAPVPALIAAAGAVIRTDIRCLDPTPRTFHRGRVVLLGDAAHAMTPNLGQGACQALEDAVVLAAYAGEPGGLARYSAERVLRTTAVAAASRRIGRMAGLSGLPARLRDAGLALAGKLGPNLVLRQMDPIFAWRPPR
ncbi:monooxygenase [Paractinoplanes abujensis]|uniref:2-polyprenyl-6-methoxyphenol hydroxylase-like FAD-dependent oxidoreductase n=1 Tax=Paractinoplanes abujensis TaxID=882441 RepID=A0A7W7D0S0_9ACTN|nr:FAD-dependent monooxygenase [Actinoplanes abujensis]MBB4698219.1 2-polyprenyl-6-methoxyphenol hydroxylase-like FAD-dependent oxidoreductase [Actinoplanes abujensis]GID19295.1 monooxygenase [Actinoplanes abujensis]